MGVIEEYAGDSPDSLPINLPPGAIAPQALETYGSEDESIIVLRDGIPTWVLFSSLRVQDHTHHVAHGSLYIHEGAVNVDISTAGQGVYVKIEGWSVGVHETHAHGVMIVDDAFVIMTPGGYKVHWSISGDSTGQNKDYEVDVFVNGVEDPEASARKTFGAAASLGNLGSPGIVVVGSVGDTIDLRMKETGGGAGSDFDIFNAGFFIDFADPAEVERD